MLLICSSGILYVDTFQLLTPSLWKSVDLSTFQRFCIYVLPNRLIVGL